MARSSAILHIVSREYNPYVADYASHPTLVASATDREGPTMRTIISAGFGITIGFLAICGNASARPANAVEQKAVVAGMADQLLDPYSAQYTFDMAKEDGNIGTVCGTVNSKNKFGGYVGKRWFIAILDKKKAVSVIVLPENGSFSTIESLCSTPKGS